MVVYGMGHQMVLCWGGALACQQAVGDVGDIFVMISMELVLEMRPWLCYASGGPHVVCRLIYLVSGRRE